MHIRLIIKRKFFVSKSVAASPLPKIFEMKKERKHLHKKQWLFLPNLFWLNFSPIEASFFRGFLQKKAHSQNFEKV